MMRFFGDNSARLFKKFYKKTGIQLTDEPIYKSEWEEKNLEDFAFELRDSPKKTIPKLIKAIKSHPELPILKNYLYSAYVLTGNTKKARILLEKTLKEHPNYVFGVTNKILNIHDKKELLKHGHLLKEPRDVREFTGYDQPVHISIFKNYQFAAAYYEMRIGEDYSAVKRLETLMDVGVEEEFLEQFAQKMAICRFFNFTERMTEYKEVQKVVEGKQKVHLTGNYSSIPPELVHPELKVFYEKETNALSQKERQQIIALPRNTLIQDLETIVTDSMKRWEYFGKTDYEENTHEFAIHALYFLGALKSEQSLQTVLDLFRMGEDFLAYWFSDWIEGIMDPVLFALGQHQLEQLKDFVLEQDVHSSPKMIVAKIPSQVAIHQPERREEVIRWYEEVFQAFRDNSDDKRLMDTDFLSFTIDYITDFRGEELLPYIEQFWENGWILQMIAGKLENIKKELYEAPHESCKKPQPQNIHEYYSEVYLTRRVPTPEKEEFKTIKEQINSKAEKLILKHFSLLLSKSMSQIPEVETDYNHFDDNDNDSYDDYADYQEPVKTIKRATPKVGRNDPCPCGSGKKYKKCCLKKQ